MSKDGKHDGVIDTIFDGLTYPENASGGIEHRKHNTLVDIDTAYIALDADDCDFGTIGASGGWGTFPIIQYRIDGYEALIPTQVSEDTADWLIYRFKYGYTYREHSTYIETVVDYVLKETLHSDYHYFLDIHLGHEEDKTDVTPQY